MGTEEPSLASQNEKPKVERPVRPKPTKRKNKGNFSGGKMTTTKESSSCAVTPYSRPLSSTTDTVTTNNPADKPYVFNVSVYLDWRVQILTGLAQQQGRCA